MIVWQLRTSGTNSYNLTAEHAFQNAKLQQLLKHTALQNVSQGAVLLIKLKLFCDFPSITWLGNETHQVKDPCKQTLNKLKFSRAKPYFTYHTCFQGSLAHYSTLLKFPFAAWKWKVEEDAENMPFHPVFQSLQHLSNFTTNQHQSWFQLLCSRVATTRHVLKVLVPLSVKKCLVQRCYSHTREH